MKAVQELIVKLKQLAEENNLHFEHHTHNEHIHFYFNDKTMYSYGFTVCLHEGHKEGYFDYQYNKIKYLLIHEYKLIKEKEKNQ
jgi:hypothetical protein